MLAQRLGQLDPHSCMQALVTAAPNLRTLKLTRVEVGDYTLYAMGHLTALKTLSCEAGSLRSEGSVTNPAAMAALSSLVSLEELRLSCEVSALGQGATQRAC